MKSQIDLGEFPEPKSVRDALLFASFIVGSSIGLSQFAYFAPGDEMKDARCRARFEIAIDGFIGPGVDRAKSECRAQFAIWISELPPTRFNIGDEGITVGSTTLSADGLSARKGHILIAGIGDIAFPAVHLHHAGGALTLRFQTDAQADTAFRLITERLNATK